MPNMAKAPGYKNDRNKPVLEGAQSTEKEKQRDRLIALQCDKGSTEACVRPKAGGVEVHSGVLVG